MTEDFIQENEDRELFRRIKQGSEEAFRVVYGKYHRILYAVALKMLKDRSAAENAVQHVFVKLWIGRQEMTVMLRPRILSAGPVSGSRIPIFPPSPLPPTGRGAVSVRGAIWSTVLTVSTSSAEILASSDRFWTASPLPKSK